MEFLALSRLSHPLMTVRAFECDEWAKTEQFDKILNGTYEKTDAESIFELTSVADKGEEEELDKKLKPKFEFPKFMKKAKDAEEETLTSTSIPDEIRKYKELFDEGIITEEEFSAKKKQLLGL